MSDIIIPKNDNNGSGGNLKLPDNNINGVRQYAQNNGYVLSRALDIPLTQDQGKEQIKAFIQDKFGLQNVNLETFIYESRIGRVPDQDVAPYTSTLGTPVWDNLIIKGDTYQDRTYGTITYEDIRLDTILMTLSQSHRLVLTEIQGRDNEVIEYVGKASFRINFKGGVFGTNNNRPKQDIQNIKKFLNSNKVIKIQSCGFLTEWDISEIAILDKSIPQTMGGYNYQLFEFNAIQSVPVILAAKTTTNAKL